MSTTHLPELPWQAAGAVDTSHSAHARLRPVPIHAVTMGDGFWKPRMEGNRTSGIAGFLAWLDEDGQVAPFRAYAHFARTGDSSRIAARSTPCAATTRVGTAVACATPGARR